eukprot:gene4115-7401_t
MSFITLFHDEQGEIIFEIGRTNKKEITWYDETVKLPNYWEEKTKLRVCINSNEPPHKIPKPIEDFHVPLLKSALQKGVRRRKAEAALHLAWQLISQDLTEFLRRFPVIILEDSVLHPNFSNIVWMMIANSKGWKLRKTQIELLLQTVYQIASCEYRDYLDFESEEFSNPCYNTNNHLLASIILRVNYGGMKGDQEFMKKLVMMWHNRFKIDYKIWNDSFDTIFPPIPKEIQSQITSMVEKKSFLKNEYKLNEGIDYHVFPSLIDQLFNVLKDKKKFIPVNDLKSIIWLHRSGISLKKYITTRKSLLKLDLQNEYETDEKLSTFDTWKDIKEDWIELCSEVFWRSYISEEFSSPKEKKTKIQNHKITDFFKIK